MEGLLEALSRLARDAAIGVVVPAYGGASSSRTLRRRSDRDGLVGARVAQGPYDVAPRASCAPLS